jgi:hypothetical protein
MFFQWLKALGKPGSATTLPNSERPPGSCLPPLPGVSPDTLYTYTARYVGTTIHQIAWRHTAI